MLSLTVPLCFFFVVFVFVHSVPLGEVRPANEEARQVAMEIRPRIEEFYGHRLREYTVIAFKRKTMAGTHYVIKLKIDDDQYIHVKLFHSLSGQFTRLGVQRGHTKISPIEWFD